MRLLVSGGTGALDRAFIPVARAAGHDVRAPGHSELDLFDPAAVTAAAREADEAPSGIYNVCRDGERVANQRFQAATGWRAQR